MPAKASLPALAESAITTLFENAINGTRIFWSQRDDASLVCVQWSWCCPEIPAVLSGMDAVVFVTSGPASVFKAPSDVLVVSLDARHVWGKWTLVHEPPNGVKAATWDDLREVVI